MSIKKVPLSEKKGPYTPYFLLQRDCEAYILHNFQLSFYIKMRLREILHNDVTSPYYRKHSAVSGTFSEN